jgi:hypothetical protein
MPQDTIAGTPENLLERGAGHRPFRRATLAVAPIRANALRMGKTRIYATRKPIQGGAQIVGLWRGNLPGLSELARDHGDPVRPQGRSVPIPRPLNVLRIRAQRCAHHHEGNEPQDSGQKPSVIAASLRTPKTTH